MTPRPLSIVPAPSGNLIVMLDQGGGRFATGIVHPDSIRDVSRDEAERWHRMARTEGAVCCGFPRKGREG